MGETILERQTRMNKTVNGINRLIKNYTPAESFGILETVKLEIHAKVFNVVNHIKGSHEGN